MKLSDISTRSIARIPALITALTFVGFIAQAVPTSAQPNVAGRRQFVEGMLKMLIESQINRQPKPQPAPQPPRPQPRPHNHKISADLTRARTSLQGFATEAHHLASHLHAQSRSNPNLRYHLSDALRLNASARVLVSRAASARTFDPLVDDFRTLDKDWRLLSHKLSKQPGLTAECRTCMKELDQFDAQLCDILHIGPQVDFRELTSATESLRAALDRLGEDIGIELARTSAGRSLMYECRQVEQKALAVCNAVSARRPYDHIVVEFERLHEAWERHAVRVRSVNNRFLERDVRQIDQIVRDTHEILWLPLPLDYSLLSHITKTMTADVNGLFDCVSLNALMELRGADNILDAACEFHGLCEHLADGVQHKESLPELQQDFQYLNDSWPKLAACFQGTKDARIIKALKDIEGSFETLQGTLQLRPVVDTREVVSYAAGLEDLSGRLAQTVQHYLNANSRYDTAFKKDCIGRVYAFRDSARHLHEVADSEGNHNHLREDCDDIAAQWNAIQKSSFGRMHSADRARLQPLTSSIAAQIVQLQTIIQ